MSRNAKLVLEDALALPAEERAEIASALLGSLEPPSEADSEVEMAWRHEIAARMAVLAGGRVTAVPWEEVRGRLLARLG